MNKEEEKLLCKTVFDVISKNKELAVEEVLIAGGYRANWKPVTSDLKYVLIEIGN